MKVEIKLKGTLGQHRESWFDGMRITSTGPHTILTGDVDDEAALHGILNKIRDLNLQLISIQTDNS